MSMHVLGAGAFWSTSARTLHWLVAASLAGAAVITDHGEMGHGALGWLALAALLAWQFRQPSRRPHPTLPAITAMLFGLNMSGWLAPASSAHAGLTLAAMAVASLYCATVLFESLRRVETAWPDGRPRLDRG